MARGFMKNERGMRYSPFRLWLREQIRSCGKQVLEFAADSGLSRHICSTHSRQFDPCLESITLACETLAIWKGISFEQQLLEGLRHTVHFRNSSQRAASSTGCNDRAQIKALGDQAGRSSKVQTPASSETSSQMQSIRTS